MSKINRLKSIINGAKLKFCRLKPRISKDLFTSILSYLPKESIAALITNTNLDKAIKESAKTNIFWKQRIETSLGTYLDQNLRFSNWKLIYDNLIEDFGKIWSKALIRAASKNGHSEVVKLLLADKRG